MNDPWGEVQTATQAVMNWWLIHKPLSMSESEARAGMEAHIADLAAAWDSGRAEDMARLHRLDSIAITQGFPTLEAMIAAVELAVSAKLGEGVDAAVERAPGLNVVQGAVIDTAPAGLLPTSEELAKLSGAAAPAPTEGYAGEESRSPVAANENPNSVIGIAEAK